MHKIIFVLVCSLLAIKSYGQTCQNPGARAQRLSAIQNKDSVYQWIKPSSEWISSAGQNYTYGAECYFYPNQYEVQVDYYVNFTSANLYTTYFLEYSPIRVQIVGTLTVSGISSIGYNA